MLIPAILPNTHCRFWAHGVLYGGVYTKYGEGRPLTCPQFHCNWLLCHPHAWSSTTVCLLVTVSNIVSPETLWIRARSPMEWLCALVSDPDAMSCLTRMRLHTLPLTCVVHCGWGCGCFIFFLPLCSQTLSWKPPKQWRWYSWIAKPHFLQKGVQPPHIIQ